MSVSKWRWKEICDTRPCPGDCDLCDYEDDYDEMKYIIMCGGHFLKAVGMTFEELMEGNNE